MIRLIYAAGLFARVSFFLAAVAVTTAVSAGFIKPSYSEFVLSTTQSMAKMADDIGLSESERQSAERAAAIFFLYGPCRGTVLPHEPGREFPIISIPAEYDATENKINTAISAFVGSLFRRHDLGRTPNEFSCRFAADRAYPGLPAELSIRVCLPQSKPNDNGSSKCLIVR